MIDSLKEQVRDQAWTFLEASNRITTAIRAGNRKRTSTEAGWVKAAMAASTPDALPLIRIDMPRTTSGGFPLSAGNSSNFAMEDADFAASGATCEVSWTFNLQVTLFGDVKKQDEQDHLIDNVILAFLAPGPKFGLTWVTGTGTITVQQGEFVTPNGVRQLRAVVTVPFNASFDFQWLRSQATA